MASNIIRRLAKIHVKSDFPVVRLLYQVDDLTIDKLPYRLFIFRDI